MKTIDDLIACARRELGLRHAVYPRRVADRKMSQDKASHEIQCMADIVATLESLKSESDLRAVRQSHAEA